ncbi:hypothetical protein [Polaribacter butkevichii]|uniref:Curlin subunit CsgB n=1 Tax=Polaribacter butkevichii TaxID=218490 RepID=A0A2P6CBA6_9FLAO|nr:hypothetical protein [Polaribacter butkevichii]PQJ72196.1 hypothetical protein BTO14_02555 [Polaribacter butkevichii]
MESIKKISIVCLFLLSFLASAQDEKLPSYFSDQLQFDNSQLPISTINNFQINSQEMVSTISLKQIGNANVTNIDDRFSNGDHRVYQIGNGNNYQFLNYNSNQPINLGVLQSGNDNSLEVQGINSVFQNLKIVQFGGAKMSVINY